MNRTVFLLLVVMLPTLGARPTKASHENVYVTRSHALFASEISDWSNVDFANTRAIHVGSYGEVQEWQTLKLGKGKTNNMSRSGVFEGMTEVHLGWRRSLDAEHWVVDYDWFWAFGSSNQSDIVQVFEFAQRQDPHHAADRSGPSPWRRSRRIKF
jgi:hypothetical protein